MRPAFSSTRQAAAFALMLLVLLLSPVLMGKRFLPPREEIYSAMTWRFGPFNSFFRKQIFEETNDVDIAFVGSSRLWAGIDTPYVQQKLSEALGRKATVLTLGWAWPGFDAEYFITRDLLEHRKVRMIVFDDEYWVAPHVAATHWFRFGDDAGSLGGLPLEVQAPYYFASVIGMPRNLLGLVRREIPGVIASEDDEHWRKYFHSQNSDERLGALTMEGWADTNAVFSTYLPGGNAKPSDVSVYSSETSNQFQFTGSPTRPQQLKFAKNFADAAGFATPPLVTESSWDLKFAELAREHDVKPVFLHLCPIFPADEPSMPVIRERVCWPEVLGTNVSMVGIAPAKLFSGLDETEIARLFFAPDHYHFNQNGQKFFTSIITPTLLQLYENQNAH